MMIIFLKQWNKKDLLCMEIDPCILGDWERKFEDYRLEKTELNGDEVISSWLNFYPIKVSSETQKILDKLFSLCFCVLLGTR